METHPSRTLEKLRRQPAAATPSATTLSLSSPPDLPFSSTQTPGLRGSIRGSIRSLKGSLRRHKQDTAFPVVHTVPLKRTGAPLIAPQVRAPANAVLSGTTTVFDDPKSGAPTVASTVASTHLFHTPETGRSAALSASSHHSRHGLSPYSGETAKSTHGPKDPSVTNSSRTQSPAFSGDKDSMYSPFSSAVLSGLEKPVVFEDDPVKGGIGSGSVLESRPPKSPKSSRSSKTARSAALSPLHDMTLLPQEVVGTPAVSAVLKSAIVLGNDSENTENTDPDMVAEAGPGSGSGLGAASNVEANDEVPSGEENEEFGIANLLFLDGSDEFDYTLDTFPKMATLTKDDKNLSPIVEVDSTAVSSDKDNNKAKSLPSPTKELPLYAPPLHRSLSNVSNIAIVHNVAIESASGAASLSSVASPALRPPETKALMEERRSQCLQELILSEESYLSSLRMLANMYFATIESCSALGKEAVMLLENDTRSLIEFHQELLDDIQLEYPNITISNKPAAPTLQVKISPAANDFTRAVWTSLKDVPPGNVERLGYRDGKWVKPALTTLSPQFAARISQLVADKAISLYLYEQYCINYDATIELLRSYRDAGRHNERFWVKGCENLLNASQMDGRRKDLSLQSLMIIPAARISKYKLILEQLAKNTCPIEEAQSHAVILDSLDKVEVKLRQIDHNHLVEKFRRQSHILWNCLHFKYELPFSVQYFGLAILCGALNITWIAPDGSIKFYYMGCFLFKSYLIMANVTNPEGRFYVKFIIPLHCCRIESPVNTVVGLQTSSVLTKKLIFEHDFGLYEVLLTATTAEELRAWHEKLEVQILSINGVYMWDFKASDMSLQGYNSASRIPPMKALSVAFQKKSRWRHFFGSYNNGLGDPLATQLKIQHFFVDGDLDSNYGTHTAATRDENDGVKCETIHIRRYARLEAEKALGIIWSTDELPLIPSRQADETYQPVYNVRNMVRRVASMRSNRGGNWQSGSNKFGGNRSRSLPHEGVSVKDYFSKYDTSSGSEEFFDALSHARSVWATPHEQLGRASRFSNIRKASNRIRRFRTRIWKS